MGAGVTRSWGYKASSHRGLGSWALRSLGLWSRTLQSWGLWSSGAGVTGVGVMGTAVWGCSAVLAFLESSGDLPVFRQWWDWLLLRGGLVVGGGDGLRAAERMGTELL